MILRAEVKAINGYRKIKFPDVSRIFSHGDEFYTLEGLMTPANDLCVPPACSGASRILGRHLVYLGTVSSPLRGEAGEVCWMICRPFGVHLFLLATCIVWDCFAQILHVEVRQCPFRIPFASLSCDFSCAGQGRPRLFRLHKFSRTASLPSSSLPCRVDLRPHLACFGLAGRAPGGAPQPCGGATSISRNRPRSPNVVRIARRASAHSQNPACS